VAGSEPKGETRVACPRCGRLGTLAIDAFKAKGWEYKYVVVRHGERRCILARVGAVRRIAAERSAPLGERLARLEETVSELLARVEELEERVRALEGRGAGGN